MAAPTPPSTAPFTQNGTQPTIPHSTSQLSVSTPRLTLPPSTLDILPLITSILLRLQSSNPNASTTLTAGGTPQIVSTPSASALASSSIDKSPFSTAPLTTKEVPLAVDELKQRIRRARAEIGRLDDMSRTAEEQQEEISDLKRKIAEQRKAVEDLKVVGRRAMGIKPEGLGLRTLEEGEMDVS